MADPSDSSDLKHMFSTFVGFGTKGPPDSDAGRSPTSPLDFGGLFSPRSPHRNKWLSPKVGLSFLGDVEALTSDNIVLSPQIKKLHLVNPNQLSTLPCVHASNIHPHPSQHTSPSSSPMDIIPAHAYSRSLSGRDMALSEDYTCIISHGPNPKTTHIFGDCILDCDPKELGGLDTKQATDTPQDCHNTLLIHREVSASEKGGVEDSLEISPGSSYNEDLFPMAMPLNP